MRLFSPVRLAIVPTLLALAGTSSKPSAPADPPPTQTEKTEPAPAKQAELEAEAPKQPGALPDTLPNGLLLSYSQFEVVDGKATAKPGPARLDIVTREGGA